MEPLPFLLIQTNFLVYNVIKHYRGDDKKWNCKS
nr:MAG TPA: hypothetical protein [Caudoviricetes sp.]